MKGLQNYDQIQEYTESKKLPVGAYKVNIIRAEEQNNALCLLFDIAEGEYKDYYKQKFNADKAKDSNAKYKGVLRLYYPSGKKYDQNNMSKMKSAFENLRRSNIKLKNVDFSKEWDGAVLKSCAAGMIFREKEWEYNSYKGTFAEPFKIISLEDLESGNFTMPQPKLLNENKNTENYSNSYSGTDSNDDLPF